MPSGTMNPLDKDTFFELLKTVGLPGLVLIAWLVSAVTGSAVHENFTLWGMLLVAAGFLNFTMFQMKSWRDAIVDALKQTIEQSNRHTTEAMELLVSTQNQMVSNTATLLSLQEGSLSLPHMRVLSVYMCEALKWKTWSVCIGAFDRNILATTRPKHYQEAIEVQAQTLLRQLSSYNEVMKRPEIEDAVHKAITNIIEHMFGIYQDYQDHAEMEATETGAESRVHFSERVKDLVEKIRVEYDMCARSILEVIDIQRIMSDGLMAQ